MDIRSEAQRVAIDAVTMKIEDRDEGVAITGERGSPLGEFILFRSHDVSCPDDAQRCTIAPKDAYRNSYFSTRRTYRIALVRLASADTPHDQLHYLISTETLSPSEVEQVVDPTEHRSALRRADNPRPATAREVEQPLVA